MIEPSVLASGLNAMWKGALAGASALLVFTFGRVVLFYLGCVVLRLITAGRYPRPRHFARPNSVIFLAGFAPFVVLWAAFVVVNNWMG